MDQQIKSIPFLEREYHVPHKYKLKVSYAYF